MLDKEIFEINIKNISSKEEALTYLSDKLMGTNDVEVSVKVIFMLALKEAHSQLTILQQLIEILQDKEIMEKLMNMDEYTTSKEVKELLAIKNIK